MFDRWCAVHFFLPTSNICLTVHWIETCVSSHFLLPVCTTVHLDGNQAVVDPPVSRGSIKLKNLITISSVTAAPRWNLLYLSLLKMYTQLDTYFVSLTLAETLGADGSIWKYHVVMSLVWSSRCRCGTKNNRWVDWSELSSLAIYLSVLIDVHVSTVVLLHLSGQMWSPVFLCHKNTRMGNSRTWPVTIK